MATINHECCPRPSQVKEELVVEEQLTETEEQFLVNKEIRAQHRFGICETCPELIPVINTCRQCGCFMKIKTRIYSASCPLGKW